MVYNELDVRICKTVRPMIDLFLKRLPPDYEPPLDYLLDANNDKLIAVDMFISDCMEISNVMKTYGTHSSRKKKEREKRMLKKFGVILPMLWS